MKFRKGKKTLRILIVEDQSSDAAGPYLLTQGLGHQVFLAFDGEQALIEESGSHFDLIILDWNMPYLSGREFLKTIEYRSENRKSGELPERKIVLHSGQDIDISELENCRGFQIVDYWKKPLKASEMLKKFKDLLEKMEAA
ncbi:MAG: response regulator [Bdellovibrio sp.]|jgi:CheY-like chemotaxis protein